jgi:integrase
MARRVRDASLESRTARAKLATRGKPYYRSIGPGLHVGYRKGDEARKWVARIYIGSGAYKVEVIGNADDAADADGADVLTFFQAQERARELAGKKVEQPAGPYTVGEAIAAYVEHLEGKATCKDTATRLAAHVAPALQSRPVDELTKDEIRAWHRGLAKIPPRVRTANGDKQQHRAVDMSDPETARKRKATANNLLTMLKAALNHALAEEKVGSDKAWKRVKPFEKVSKARERYLTIAEAKRLINACDPDFRKLVQAALMTGCRYQELARLTVSDFNPDSGSVLIQTSKSGKPRHVMLSDEGVTFFRSLTVGRAGDELMLGRPWRHGNQANPMKVALRKAKISPPISFHGLRHTWASLSVMGGMPLMVVARNLGHVDTRMVEKHYGHLSASYVASEVREHSPRFGLVVGNVKAIR